ncbi:hypothetical protein Xcel_1864 [Xylanimonas cellulosilytica DSM 15894]|uniref:Lipoprotein n=1 Tax=Xylanimonas cellulosilytica (strain DSM 15894 / JCM 12276 / CECT 5975 / KCTC 9989 / LMG 20990 / NBRC 107835 / XIL07) TaxID=446471 RepID=D1BT42_XYLCX|nr:hypothetical protein [Xylanimonas cellulosilytica]ACZ30884.1 hypothetical protein Xcel_1864 [Xylanimonas cellulosilytica DSM 15894]
MRGRQTAGASALVFVALMLAGCDGANDAQLEPTGEVTQADAPENDVAQDAAACAAVSDVMTIVENAGIALREGRMAPQEQQGWYAVATRALDRIPSSGDGAVSQGIADLKEAAPAVGAGTAAEPVGIRSDAWNDALSTLSEPCLAVDAELAISMFTGG